MTISKEAVEAAYEGFIAQLKKSGWTSCDSRYIAHEKRAIEAAITALLATGEVVVNKWQPIETAPRDGTVFVAVNARGDKWPPNPYMLCFSTAEAEGITYTAEAGWKQVGHDWPSYPTHWQPLPKPPAQKEGV